MTLSFNTNNPSIPKDRWIAHLSDGSTVFEDYREGDISAWQRLSKYLHGSKIRITSLQLEAFGQIITLGGTANNSVGWWQSSRIGALPQLNVEIHSKGIGIVLDNKINIFWINEFQQIEEEIREAKKDDLAIIFNEISINYNSHNTT